MVNVSSFFFAKWRLTFIYSLSIIVTSLLFYSVKHIAFVRTSSILTTEKKLQRPHAVNAFANVLQTQMYYYYYHHHCRRRNHRHWRHHYHVNCCVPLWCFVACWCLDTCTQYPVHVVRYGLDSPDTSQAGTSRDVHAISAAFLDRCLKLCRCNHLVDSNPCQVS